jgi:peptidoglycan hydrolase-like protein with peptidoglycan-binding domain
VPGKPARRRAAASRPEAEPAADSAIARVVDRAFENPAMSGGLMVMAITAMAIMSNALFLQAGRHPEPLFSTRPAPVAQHPAKAPTAVPLPHARELPQAPVAQAPTPAPAVPVPQATPAAPAQQVADTGKALIADVQRELARLGVYTGAIDGLSGSRTRAAISSWQAAAGLKVTGEPTPSLLAALRQPIAPAPSAVPAVPVAVKQAASVDEVAQAVARAEQLDREKKAVTEDTQLRKVQGALNQIGYGPLVANGQTSQATTDAIRRFQLDNGLPVTGELNDRVVARLVSIGAMKTE